jgi:3-oxoacyl-[acyl-carrier-protein] synthase-3
MGVGCHRPERVVSNAEICTMMESSDEWIRERSGILERRWAAPDESVVDMGVLAAQEAIAAAGINPELIGTVLCATVTHPFQTPSASVEIADRIGATNAGSTDLSSACAGFAYGIGIADSLVRCGQSDYVLVVGVEKLTDFVDASDRSTGFIFADGAGAAVVGPSDIAAIGPTIWGGDGSQTEAIVLEPDFVTHRRLLAEDPSTPWPRLQMQGQAVFRWAVGEMPRVALAALDAAGLTVNDLDVFIPHQANMRITDAMVRALKLSDNVVVARDITTTGNTSGASIPLAMRRMLDAGDIHSGQTALLIGFGAGLAYAAQVVTIP